MLIFSWTASSDFGTYRLCISAVSPEPPLLAHTSSESRGTFRQKARSLAPLNGWARAVKICNDGMLEDTNSLDGAQLMFALLFTSVAATTYINVEPHRAPFAYSYHRSSMRTLYICPHIATIGIVPLVAVCGGNV